MPHARLPDLERSAVPNAGGSCHWSSPETPSPGAGRLAPHHPGGWISSAPSVAGRSPGEWGCPWRWASSAAGPIPFRPGTSPGERAGLGWASAMWSVPTSWHLRLGHRQTGCHPPSSFLAWGPPRCRLGPFHGSTACASYLRPSGSCCLESHYVCTDIGWWNPRTPRPHPGDFGIVQWLHQVDISRGLGVAWIPTCGLATGNGPWPIDASDLHG